MPPKSQIQKHQRATDLESTHRPIREGYTLRSTTEAATAASLGEGEAVPFCPSILSPESDEDTISAMSTSSDTDKATSDKEPSMAYVLSVMSEMLQLSRAEINEERRRAAKREEEAAKWREDEEVRRERREKVREAEKIIDKIPAMSDKQDVELYLQGLENELQQVEYPRHRWKAILTSRLTPSLKDLVADLQADPASDFEHLKERLLNCVGLTEAQAGQTYHDMNLKDLKSKSTAEVMQWVFRLLGRISKGAKTIDEFSIKLATARIRAFMSPRGKQFLDCKNITTAQDMRKALLTWETTEGSLFPDESSLGNGFHQRSGSSFNCFRCGKPGHRAAECRTATVSNDQQNPTYPQPKCFICGTIGHKSPDCPSKSAVKKEQGEPTGKEVKKTLKNNRVSVIEMGTTEQTVMATIGDLEVPVLLDTGAQITVLPEEVVPAAAKTGQKVRIKGYIGTAVARDLARVKIRIGGKVWDETVALVTESELGGKGLLAVNLDRKESWELLDLVRKREFKVNAVETRAQYKAREREEKENERDMARENAGTSNLDLSEYAEYEDDEVGDSEMAFADESGTSAGEEGGDGSSVGESVEVSSEQEERTECQLVVPCVKGGNDREMLISETKCDPSLNTLRDLADHSERGYFWDEGILMQRRSDLVLGATETIVVPKSRRLGILKQAHDRSGHLGYKKVMSVIKQNFVWPLLYKEVRAYCNSCVHCQKYNKCGQRKHPMIERPIITQPFETIALDLVGPLPKGRGGARFILTAICMATRWPEAIALRSITAKSVAEAVIEIFGRMGLPYQVLTDRGTQFTGALAKQLHSMLGIDHLKTSPYHPQSNGVLERVHSVLEAMLAKAQSIGLDWVRQLPFVLFALRQSPNRTTGFSPYEMIYGKNVRTPLDVLYEGWRGQTGEGLDVVDWVEELSERLEAIRDVAVRNGLLENNKRKQYYDKGSVERVFQVGDRVLCRISGLVAKLEDSWEGPYIVMKRVSAVNYEIEPCDGKKRKRVVHVNMLKRFHDRELEVCALTVIADDPGLDESLVRLKEDLCEGYNEDELQEVLGQFSDVMNDKPGKTSVVEMGIQVEEGTRTISQGPYRIPDRLKAEVKKEIDTLLEDGIIEYSNSAWCSPCVPVVKPDGRVRLCVDYRRLNQVTPQLQQVIPTLDDVLESAGGARVLSKMDLAKGYYQVCMQEDAKDLTTFISPWGRYRFNRMPFGLRNAPAVFQSLMESVLKDCNSFASVYIDDVLIYSNSWSEHLVHIEQVLWALKVAGLTAKPSKCQWGRQHLEYLGHKVGCGEVAVPNHRVEDMANFRQPVTKRELKAFLGSIGYYRRFVSVFANYSQQLTPATSKTAPGKVEWTPDMLSAFNHLRKCLCSHCVLTVPCVSDHFQLHTDASGVGIGAVLNVIRDGVERPVAFYSRQLRGPECRYSATEVEALAVVCAVEHFAHFLYGAKFSVLTDHRPLTALLSSKTLNRRLRGMALKLMEFGIDIQYREGSKNGNADALSRQSWPDEEGKLESPITLGDGDENDSSEEDEDYRDCERDRVKTSVDVPSGEVDLAGADLSGEGCGAAHK